MISISNTCAPLSWAERGLGMFLRDLRKSLYPSLRPTRGIFFAIFRKNAGTSSALDASPQISSAKTPIKRAKTLEKLTVGHRHHDSSIEEEKKNK